MAFVHDQSCECAKSELDVFSVPLTQTSIEYGNYVEYHPLSSITDSGPFEFDVSSSGQTTWIFQTLNYYLKSNLSEAAVSALPMSITWVESICLYIVCFNKWTSH